MITHRTETMMAEKQSDKTIYRESSLFIDCKCTVVIGFTRVCERDRDQSSKTLDTTVDNNDGVK